MADVAANLVPFERGNRAALTHGASALLALAPRADEIAAALDDVVPTRTDADMPAIRACALALAQVEQAAAYLDEHGLVDGRGHPRPVAKHLGTMLNTATRLLSQLGCTPLARAQLGLDLSRARGEALRAHLAENYGGGARSVAQDTDDLKCRPDRDQRKPDRCLGPPETGLEVSVGRLPSAREVPVREHERAKNREGEADHDEGV